MSAVIRTAQSADVESICSLLHTKMNTRIPVNRWRQLMSYQWLKNKPDFGRVVESDGKILGFCGMVYADRMLGEPNGPLRQERIVSMSSWYLDKTLRGKGLGRDMLLSAIGDPTLTYATLTNSKKPLAIVEALGFNVLEDHRYVWQKSGKPDPSIVLLQQPDDIYQRVERHQQQILDDMADQPLVPVLIEADGSQVLMFFSVKSKGENIQWFDLMYSSNHGLFTQYAQDLANRLLPDSPSRLAADGRFVSNPPAGVTREALPVARYFVSQRVARHEIDHLYSELQLLDLKLD